MSLRNCIIALCLFALVAGSLSACTKQEVGEKLPPVVSVQSVEQFTPVQEDTYSSVVLPASQVDVAFKGSGYVDSIHQVRGLDGQMRILQEGDFVRRGTVLARLRQSDYLLRVRQQAAAIDEVREGDQRAQAARDECAVSLQQARDDFDRASRLYQSDSITKPEYEGAKTKVAVYEARLRDAEGQIGVNKATARRAEAGLAEARSTLRDCLLLAPSDGTIIKRSVEQGTLAGNGMVGFTMADTRSVKVSFGVPDVKLRDIKLGQRVSVTSEAVPGKVFDGSVTDIAPAADPKSRVFNTEVTISNRQHLLRPGMVATLESGPTQTAVALPAIPVSAVIKSSRSPDSYSVYVIRDQGGKVVVEERTVKLGEASGQLITVVEGLGDSDRVVVNGTNKIASGQEVRILN